MILLIFYLYFDSIYVNFVVHGKIKTIKKSDGN